MLNHSEMQKIKRYSRVLRYVMSAFYWIALVVAGVSLIAAITVIFIPDSNFVIGSRNSGRLQAILGDLVNFDLTEAAQGISMKDVCVTILFMAVLALVLAAFVAKKLVHILKSVDNDTPFEKENAERIHAIGTIFVLGSFFIPAFEYIPARVMLNLLKAENIGLNYSVNVYMALAGLLLFILSGIFKYGSYLQDEYDETV